MLAYYDHDGSTHRIFRIALAITFKSIPNNVSHDHRVPQLNLNLVVDYLATSKTS